MKTAALFILATQVATACWGLAFASPEVNASAEQAARQLATDQPVEAGSVAAEASRSGDPDALFLMAFLHDLGAGVRLDHERAHALLQQAIEQSHRPSAEYLAWKCRVGFGIDRDPSESVRLAALAHTLPARKMPVPDRWLIQRGDDFAPAFRRALLWLLEAADAGDVTAMANLADVFLATEWTAPDLGSHVHWLKLAAEAGEARSLERLASYHRFGLFGVRTDDAKAHELLRRAAEAGLASAQYAVAKQMIRTLEDGPADRDKAIRWYRAAADSGHVEALIELGRMYRDGSHVTPNDAEAVRLFSRGAELGDATALGDLGWMYATGRGVEKDLAKSAELYQRASERGNGWAAAELGWQHKSGRLGRANPEAALAAFRRAAELENTSGMNGLGDLYFEGVGVDKDLEQAFIWYERSAREGDAWAQNRVGWMLRNGYGVETDDEEAVHWFHLAADKGDANAIGNLGYHFARGLGVERDPMDAFSKLVESLRLASSDFFCNELRRLIGSMGAVEHAQVAETFNRLLEESIDPNGSLASCVTEFLLDGPSAHRDRRKGIDWLDRCAEAGADWALLDLAERCFLGWQTDFNVDRARELLARTSPSVAGAAERLRFQIVMACGTEAQRQQAFEALQARADLGDANAAYLLALTYAGGSLVVPDRDLALRYFEASLGSGSARRSDGKRFDRADALQQLRKQYHLDRLMAPDPAVHAGTVQRELQAAPENSRAQVIHRIQPVYPDLLKRRGILGNARVEFTVGPSGIPSAIQVVEASHPLFARAAEVALAQWRFVPAKKDGRPEPTRIAQPFSFNLQD